MKRHMVLEFPGGASDKELPASAEDLREADSLPGAGISPGEESGTHPSILARESHG